MSKMMKPAIVMMCLAVMMGLTLAGCGTVRELRQIGQPEPMAPMTYPMVYPAQSPRLMAMAQPKNPVQPNTNSLWLTGARAFFNDQRAREIGDILTVNISIADTAKVQNKTETSRSATRDAAIDGFLGFEGKLGNILPNGVDASALVDTSSTADTSGDGSIDRSESIETTVAAVVTDVLVNGNMVIAGRQEVRINNEVRELLVTGIVRPEDISAANTIKHTQIAEARISYGGRGQISRVQEPPAAHRAGEILLPF